MKFFRRFVVADVVFVVLFWISASGLIAQDADFVPGATADHPVRVSSGVMRGLLQKHPAPKYPENARAEGVSGSVVIGALVTPAGLVEQPEIISGPAALRDAALDAVRTWTYKPFVLNGKPAYVLTTITVNFSLTP